MHGAAAAGAHGERGARGDPMGGGGALWQRGPAQYGSGRNTGAAPQPLRPPGPGAPRSSVRRLLALTYLFFITFLFCSTVFLTGPIKFSEGVVTFSNVLQLIFTSDL